MSSGVAAPQLRPRDAGALHESQGPALAEGLEHGVLLVDNTRVEEDLV